jgi:DNA-binding MarR family transcriptional regulator
MPARKNKFAKVDLGKLLNPKELKSLRSIAEKSGKSVGDLVKTDVLKLKKNTRATKREP